MRIIHYLQFPFFRSKKGMQLLFFGFVFSLGILLFFLRESGAPPRVLNNDTDSVKTLGYWSDRIDKRGAEEAYREFTSFYGAGSHTTQHPVAHIMGALLYEKFGNEGLAVCDSSFSFGCYHQFFANALADAGPEVVRKLDEVCVEKFGRYGNGCQHGIGHGLVEYFGYGSEALLKELSLCSLTTVVGDYFGCSSGVFMQYNIPISFNGREVKSELRPFDSQNPTFPCNAFIPESYKKSCYFSLGQWWFTSNREPVEKLGIFCALDNSSHREACYLGLGSTLIHKEGYDYLRTLSLCELMPDREAELLCRAGAAWGLFAEPSYRSKTAKLCEGLSLEEEKFCRNKSDLIGNQEIFQVISST